MLKLNNFSNTIIDHKKAINLLPSNYTSGEQIGESYLKLTLTTNLQVAIAMKYIEQVLISPAEKITFLPNLPNYVIGLFNQRNRVFWLIQLSLLMKLKSNIKNLRNYEIVIIKVNNIPLALAVEKVNNMIRFPESNIKSMSEYYETYHHIKDYLKGYILSEKEHIFIINPHKIILNNYQIS